MPKAKLLEQFIHETHSVLVATSSFWEGVDVRGDALSLVIIDKLPFTAPDEPLLKARIEDCRLQGGDPFNDIQIPEAVITLISTKWYNSYKMRKWINNEKYHLIST